MILDARCLTGGKVHIELLDCKDITSPDMGCNHVFIHANGICYTPRISKRIIPSEN